MLKTKLRRTLLEPRKKNSEQRNNQQEIKKNIGIDKVFVGYKI